MLLIRLKRPAWPALLTLLSMPLLLAGDAPPQAEPPPVGPPPATLKLGSFYKKHASASGLPVVSSEKVPDRALLAAAEIVNQMLINRPDVRQQLIADNMRIAVMAKSEVTTDIPEHSDLTPRQHWDQRARGLGATHARPATSCAEENLLGYQDDRYLGESILIHEFAHTIHEIALAALDEQFNTRLEALYQQAISKGLWKGTYAAGDHKEYWAEGVQCWFDANLTADPPNGIHNHVGTRAALKRYDPDLAELIAGVFGEIAWRWDRPGAHRGPRDPQGDR